MKKSKKRLKTEEFDEWKQKVLSKPKAGLAFILFPSHLSYFHEELPKNVWRQSTLTGFVKPRVLTPAEENEANEAKNDTSEDKNPSKNVQENNTNTEDKTSTPTDNTNNTQKSTKNVGNKSKDKPVSKGMKKVLVESKKKPKTLVQV